MRARAVAEILESTSSDAKFAKGKLVLASTNWSEYVVLPAKDCQPAPPLPGGLSETHYLGALGLTGLTAYYGLAEVAAAKKDDVVVVSGAAGATGCMVVQIAKKMLGCKRVIGVAGGPDKCAWVTQQMGADACVDYKSPDLKSQLVQALDGAYADVFFDNVAGEVLDVMFTLMAQHGRIAQCGAISGYNAESDPYHMKNYFYVVSQRIKVEGFIVLDAVQKPGWAAGTIGKFQEAVKEGRLKLTNVSSVLHPAGGGAFSGTLLILSRIWRPWLMPSLMKCPRRGCGSLRARTRESLSRSLYRGEAHPFICMHKRAKVGQEPWQTVEGMRIATLKRII